MKKVIIFLLFTFLFIPFKSIKANNEYDLPIGKDIKINSINKKYKWYKLKEVDSRTENVFEHSCEYLMFKETNFTEWNKEKPESKYGRTIEEKELSTDIIKYSKVIISNIYSPSLHIKELKLYDENYNELSYSNITCDNCSNQDNINNIFDNNYNTTVEVSYNSLINITLDNETSSNIRVLIIYEKNDFLYGWKVSAFDIKSNKVIYSKNETINTMVKIYSPIYGCYINSSELSWFNNSTKYYRYKDSYLLCYEKEYLDDYYESFDNYIKDETSFINSYDYEEVKPNVIEKEVFKEIIVPKEKIVNKYITIEKEVPVSETKSCEYVIKNEVKENKDVKENKKISYKVYVVFALFLSLIVVLCLFLKELIKRCR